MEWNPMEAIGAYFLMDGPDEPGDDCEDVLDDMLEALSNDDPNYTSRRRMNMEKVIEKELVPLLKVCKDDVIFEKAVRLMANLSQPFDQYIPSSHPNQQVIATELRGLLVTAKTVCTDMEFLKAFSAKMKEMLKLDVLDMCTCQCLNHCVLLLRNLFHVRPGTPANDQANVTQQCLISSFFMNELDKVIYTMLNHKNKEVWTIGVAQLISFLFKDYSGSLLEPDIDDTRSASSSDDHNEVVELLAQSDRSAQLGSGGSEQNLSSKFKRHLKIGTVSENSRSSDDDDYMLEFKSTDDGRLEIKLTNCAGQQEDSSGSGEEMEVKGTDSLSESKVSSKNIGEGSNSSLNSDEPWGGGGKEGPPKENNFDSSENMEVVQSSMNAASCLMDMDILVSYLKKFATDIMYSGFVDLVENIMRTLLKKSDATFDHSFLMWTVGFFLSFALQQELEFDHFKEILNLDVFGFLVYEGVVCCESMQLKHRQKQDSSVEKHRLHLVVCTLNQMFRTIMANKTQEYVQSIQRCLSRMTDLHNLFVLLIRHHVSGEQSLVYLRDLVQTNHLLMMMLEEWLEQGFIQDSNHFSMLCHVKRFATKRVMAKYGSLLEHGDLLLHKDTLNVAVLTMMYHVAGSCQRQDTLIQLPILRCFSEIWVENAVKDHAEFQDLIEFVLEVFMSDAEKDPDLCAQNLFDSPEMGRKRDRGDNRRQGRQDRDRDSPMGDTASGADGESAMTTDSSAASEELSEEEQSLVFTMLADMSLSSSPPSSTSEEDRMCETVVSRLKEHGYTRTCFQVSRYLKANGFFKDDPSPLTSNSSSSTSLSSTSEEQSQSTLNNNNNNNNAVLQELSSLSDDNLVPALLDRLKEQGFESHLVWLQKQLLEAAYVKLAIKQPAYRIHVEEPIAKVFALQSKDIPIVPWDEALDDALANPYFHLLQQTLGLYTNDDPNFLFPRIPHYLTPMLLVNKARQIGPFDSLLLKFDLDTLKEGTQLDIQGNDPVPAVNTHIYNKPNIRPMESQWLNFVMRVNGEVGCKSS